MSRTLCSVIVFSLCFVLNCGCDLAETASKPESNTSAGLDREQEVSETRGPGPHGGTMVAWGGGTFLVELTIDQTTKEATAYIFGNDGKTPMPIGSKSIVLAIREPSFAMHLAPKPLGSEILGNASRFVGTHESLEQGRKLRGAISGVIGNTPYSGNFAQE